MNVSQVIDALGGTRAMIAAFDVTKQAVTNWRGDNWFPWQRHSRIRQMCAAKGIDFDPENPAPTEEGKAA
jgi:hypothetical protein